MRNIKNAPIVLRYIDIKAIYDNGNREVNKNKQAPTTKKSIPKHQNILALSFCQNIGV